MLNTIDRIAIATALTADVVSRTCNWLRIIFGLSALAAMAYATWLGRVPAPEVPQLELLAAAVLIYKLARWIRFET